MAYSDYANAISRTPLTVCEIVLDTCAESFGVAPCTAAGTECFNTFHTCRDRANYNRSMQSLYLITHNSGTPLQINERPYLLSVDYLPTEIKSSLTVSGRVKIQALDEPDTDVGIDPYVSARAKPVPGTYWKKLLARTPNYKGRTVKIYEGFLGLAWTDFQLRWQGEIYNITLGNGQVTIEAVDPLKSLADIYLPEEIELKTSGAISTSSTDLSVRYSSEMSTYTYFRIDDEAIAVNSYNTALNQVRCTRGALDTSPSSHAQNAKVTPIWVAYGNPFDIMQALLARGISATSINTTAFTRASTWPATAPDIYCQVAEPQTVEKLFFELTDLCNCRSWYNESQKVTVARHYINDPARSFTNLTDAAHILDGSVSVDLQTQNHITRCGLYWGQDVLGRDDESTSYGYLTIAVDADAESSNYYDESLSTVIYCRWLSDTAVSIEEANQAADSYAGRKLFLQRDPLKIVQLNVEIKDSTIMTGDYVNLQTDDLQDIYGAPVDLKSVVTMREPLGDGKVRLKVQELHSRYLLIMASTTVGDWSACSSSERISNGFMTDTQGVMTDGQTPGYHMY